MNSRMTKYYNELDNNNSRYHRNEELYKEISKSDLEHYDIKSNATIIGDNKSEIDVEKIKKILDTKYNNAPQRKSIRLDNDEIDEDVREETKEYDINVILEKAKETKVDNYEEERLKKLRDTQYDILNNLDIVKEDTIDSDDGDDNLKELIKTIALNEQEKKDTDLSLDILEDLKGDDNTEVLAGLKEKVDEEEKTSNFDTKIINSFYTSSNVIEDKDFEDIDDFSKSIESNNIFLKIVIALIVIVFIIGIALIIKSKFFS